MRIFTAPVISSPTLEDPINFIKQAEKCLSKKGLIFTSVANDFNQIQFLALNHVKKPWWITPPEHYNYFNMTSIKRLMNRKFKIKDVIAKEYKKN